jgi:hypothetical protein
VQHVSRDENTTKGLVQQASDFRSNQGKLYVMKKSDVLISQIGWSRFLSMQGAIICFAEPDGPVSELEDLIFLEVWVT